jgi:hypothetical protein
MEETTIPKKDNSLQLTIFIAVALIIGLTGGWFLGKSQGYNKGFTAGKEEGVTEGIEQGKELGRDELLEEQEQTVQEVIDELQSAANPYDEDVTGTNPFSEGYENPFSE